MVTGGNKVTIKTPLIATRYSFIISGLRCEVADVALIWRKKSFKEFGFGSKQMESCTSLHKFIRFIESKDTVALGEGYDFTGWKSQFRWRSFFTARYKFGGSTAELLSSISHASP